jgi:hypothetical protein
VQESHPQGKLTEMRVEEWGKSESRSVMERREAEPKGTIASRESGQTSTRSLITREFDKPIKEEKQMTVDQTGASSHLVEGWHEHSLESRPPHRASAPSAYCEGNTGR